MPKTQKPGTGVSNRRRRELAAAKYERQSARRASRHAARRRRTRILLVSAGLLAAIAAVLAVVWPDPGADTVAGGDATPTPSASGTPLEGCQPAPGPKESPASWEQAPQLQLAKGTDYTLSLQTTCGEIVVDTTRAAPRTVNAMLWLAEQGYFDATACHRLTTEGIFVLQCGDPTATGTGGPGFTLPDENLPKAGADGSAVYRKGIVAMANAGTGTSGSQFFLVYEDSPLPANYTVWGTVTSGLDIVERIAEAGVLGGGPDGAPAAPIGIVSALPEPALG